MDRLRAREVLRERGGDLTPESLRELTLLATGSENMADGAYCDQILRQVSRQA
jgi:hypothetical protein